MERSRGIELSKIWDDLPGTDKFQIVKKLVGFEKGFLSTRFPMYGSLYYAKDLPGAQFSQLVQLDSKDDAVHPVFAVGPTTNRTFFDDGRDAADVNRGPCKRRFPDFLIVSDLTVNRAIAGGLYPMSSPS